MPATLLAVSRHATGATEFHFVISDAAHTQHLESMLTLEEVRAVVVRKNYGAVFNLCRAILDTTDYESLVGQRFDS